MEAVCRIKQTVFGEGMPKICIPLIARDKIALTEAAARLKGAPCEVIEWRADYYPAMTGETQIRDAFAILRSQLPDTLLLFTLRTAAEGGEKAVTSEEYLYLCRQIIAYGDIDLLDVELSAGDYVIRTLLQEAHEKGIRVILSSHDFKRTPLSIDMLRTLQRMQELGADFAKLAVMPHSHADVLALMQVTSDVKEGGCPIPLITMSMGDLGRISRIAGETFGSCMTFGCLGEASAPGQINAMDLAMMLQILHRR